MRSTALLLGDADARAGCWRFYAATLGAAAGGRRLAAGKGALFFSALLPVAWLLLRQVAQACGSTIRPTACARFRANRDVGLAVFAALVARLAGADGRHGAAGPIYLNPVRVLGDVWDELGILTDRALDRHLRARRHRPQPQRQDRVHHQPRAPPPGRPRACRSCRRSMTAAIWAPGSSASTAPTASPTRRFHADLVGASPPRWPQGHRPADHAASWSSPTAPAAWCCARSQPIQHLTLEIIDYPGEWLLDLPLLEQSFAQFSQEALALGRAAAAPGGRGRLAASGCAAFDADGPEDDGAIAALSERLPPLPASTATRSWA